MLCDIRNLKRAELHFLVLVQKPAELMKGEIMSVLTIRVSAEKHQRLKHLAEAR